ncbi:MAG: hypothetical protein HGN29_15715 [Asgard group archaeon]|nr:hypothetical protein [Asgard group archaeon]
MYTKGKIQENSFFISGFINLGIVVITALISMIFFYLLIYGGLGFDSALKEVLALSVISAVLNITFLVFYILGMQNLKSRSDLNNTSAISIISIIAGLLIFFILLITIATILVLRFIGLEWIAIAMGVLSILHGLTSFSLYYLSWRLFRKIVNHVYIKKFNLSFLLLGIFVLISNILMSIMYFNLLGFVWISPLYAFLTSIAGLFNLIASVVLILNNGELKQGINRIKAV